MMALSTLPPSPNMVLSFLVTCTVCHSLAFVITTFRLIHRHRRKQCSWDDFWALVAVCCNNIVFIFFWIRMRDNERTGAGHPPSKTAERTSHLTMTLAFIAAVWFARISIACSILRILPRGLTRSLLFAMTCLFGLAGFLLLFCKGWICGHNTSWSTDCPRGQFLNIAKLTSDIVADVCLVTVPLYLLWHTPLPKGPRYMIRAIFTASIFMVSISAVHVVYGMHLNLFLDAFTAQLESAITVMLCNFLVVGMFIYRRLCNCRDLDEEANEYATSRNLKPRATAITFMSFTKISESRLTAFLSTARRGSSLFLEDSSPTNATQDFNYPSSGSAPTSVHYRDLSVAKAGQGSAAAFDTDCIARGSAVNLPLQLSSGER